MKYIILTLIGLFLPSCTMSWQTISTRGEATDLVDENQTPTNTVSPNLNIPVKPI